MRKDPSRLMYAWGAPYFQCLDCWDEYIMVESATGNGEHSYGTEYLPGGAPQICRSCARKFRGAFIEIQAFYALRARLVHELRG